MRTMIDDDGDVFRARIRAIAATLPPESLVALKAAHDEHGSQCNAHSEGQECCFDYLTEVAE